MQPLCDNVWFQNVGEPAAKFLARMSEHPSPRSYVHLCNPHAVPEEMDRTQEVTYAAMQRARKECEAAGIKAEFLAAVFPEEESYGAKFFDRALPLMRSAKDIKAFGVERPLPLLFDIIGCAEESEADYIVFTNVDICPVPHFYRAVDVILARGYDSLVINRRTLTGWPIDPDLVDLMALDQGKPHEGYDCFVFPRKWLAGFARNNAVVGAGGVMQSLIYNLVAKAENMLFLGDVHLTWHLGDDKIWSVPHLRDYIEHNWTEAIKTLYKLASDNPQRFADFCRNFRHSRVEIAADKNTTVRLQRKVGFQGYLPDLDAINAVENDRPRNAG